ncbi:beta-ketoacyl-ACP synthase II [candidate division KSB1 bacterium]|nr:beta-ketoacyl-ACP synthase II [candidate division KSB1 bacterium]
MRDRRVVVTGLGAITPIGNDIASFWEGLSTGKSGVGPVTKFDASRLTSQIAGEVKDFDISRYVDIKEARRMDVFTHYAIAAAEEAIQNSDVNSGQVDPTRVGVIVGVGIGGMTIHHIEHTKLIEQGPRRVSPFFIPMMIPDIAAGHVSIRHGYRGPNYASVSACASGAHALGLALMHIQRGDADVMIAGGTEGTITEMAFAGFCSAKTLSCRNDEPTRASRPFDKDRNGFVMGEGAGIVVLEELSHAKKRGAKILAEFSGIGFTGDAYHITAPHETGNGAVRAMQAAIQDAGVNLNEIDYINAHGTSTALNDKIETLAIKTVFGDQVNHVAISSNKSMSGHLLGATGSVEFVATILAIQNELIPPTINYETPDPDCDLDYVPNQAREKKIKTAISNSFGFGGHNACLCLKAFEE